MLFTTSVFCGQPLTTVLIGGQQYKVVDRHGKFPTQCISNQISYFMCKCFP